MPSTITQLTSLDVYRDGGSLSASFLDNEGVECTLLFPIHLVSPDHGEFKCLGYSQPVLEKYRKVERISPVTGLSSFDWNKEEKSVAWELAREFLQEMELFIEGFVTDYAWVYPAIVKVAKASGRHE